MKSKIIAKKLKEARKQSGFTQKEVAGLLNVVESCYANWEQGRTEPNLENFKALCMIFKTSADYFLELEDDFGNKIL